MNYKELNSEEGTREDLEECRDKIYKLLREYECDIEIDSTTHQEKIMIVLSKAYTKDPDPKYCDVEIITP